MTEQNRRKSNEKLWRWVCEDCIDADAFGCSAFPIYLLEDGGVSDVFETTLLVGVFFVPMFILISRLFRRYEFTNRYINILLLFIMAFGSPIAILGAHATASEFGIAYSTSYLKVLIFIFVAVLVGLLRYISWIFISDKHIGMASLLTFSKRYVFQILYLPLVYYFIFKNPEEIIVYICLLFLFASVLVIPVYLTIKEKRIKGAVPIFTFSKQEKSDETL